MTPPAQLAAASIDAAGIPCNDCDGMPERDVTDLHLRAIHEAQRRNAEALAAMSGQVAGLASAVGAIVQRLDEGAKRMDAMQKELAANTALTKTVSDASTFVRVGTSVAKWVGAIAIAVGSVVVGVKMAAGVGGPPDIGIGPK